MTGLRRGLLAAVWGCRTGENGAGSTKATGTFSGHLRLATVNVSASERAAVPAFSTQRDIVEWSPTKEEQSSSWP